MKIALVSPYDWAVPGGVNSHLTQLAKQFIRAGHTVRIVAPSSRRGSHDCDYLTVVGENTFGFPASGSIANVCLSFNLGPRVKRLLVREGFDLVHLHEPFMPLLPFQFIRYPRAATVATFHATREGGSRLYAYSRFILKPWWPNIDGRTAVSRVALRMIGRYFPGRYRIIPNGIDYPFFAAEVPPIPHFMDHKRNILFLGRQEKRKGLPYLLEAYAQLKREMPDIRLIVVGPDGGMRAACLRYVEHHQLQDVHFTGLVPAEELPRYYKTADVFCAPNTGQESFGIVLLEAMAAGTPVVASHIEGFAGLLANGEDGLLAPPRDSQGLCSALKRLLSDDAMREEMGRQASRTAQRYSWDRVSTQVLDYYEETIAAHNQGHGATP
ncbi:MAG: glycosyltransferase family 4 protein [bacterium]